MSGGWILCPAIENSLGLPTVGVVSKAGRVEVALIVEAISKSGVEVFPGLNADSGVLKAVKRPLQEIRIFVLNSQYEITLTLGA